MSGPESRPDADPALLPGPGGRESDALDRQFGEVYAHLRDLAASYLRRERAAHTLQPTALVNEAYLRLRSLSEDQASDRDHFLALAARAMRQVLIDSARRLAAEKRRGKQVTLDEGLLGAEARAVDILALEDALVELAEIDEQRARIVELRFFAGLSCEETAEVLGLSPRTVVRRWRSSRAFLLHRLG